MLIVLELDELMVCLNHRPIKAFKARPWYAIVARVCLAYFLSLLLACISLIKEEDGMYGAVVDSNAIYGLACIPLAQNETTEYFLWFLILPLTFFIPMLFAAVKFSQVLRVLRQLANNSDVADTKVRLEAASSVVQSFNRLLFVLFVLWLPVCVCMWGVGSSVGSELGAIFMFIGGAISHLQGTVSALMALSKKDIRGYVLRGFKEPPVVLGSVQVSVRRRTSNFRDSQMMSASPTGRTRTLNKSPGSSGHSPTTRMLLSGRTRVSPTEETAFIFNLPTNDVLQSSRLGCSPRTLNPRFLADSVASCSSPQFVENENVPGVVLNPPVATVETTVTVNEVGFHLVVGDRLACLPPPATVFGHSPKTTLSMLLPNLCPAMSTTPTTNTSSQNLPTVPTSVPTVPTNVPIVSNSVPTTEQIEPLPVEQWPADLSKVLHLVVRDCAQALALAAHDRRARRVFTDHDDVSSSTLSLVDMDICVGSMLSQSDSCDDLF